MNPTVETKINALLNEIMLLIRTIDSKTNIIQVKVMSETDSNYKEEGSELFVKLKEIRNEIQRLSVAIDL